MRGQPTQQPLLAQAASPHCTLPRLCPARPAVRRTFKGQTHFSSKGLREAKGSCNGYVAPRLQPKNVDKSQAHQLLLPRLRLKPGRFHGKLASPHQVIQRVRKLEMGRFPFAGNTVIKV